MVAGRNIVTSLSALSTALSSARPILAVPLLVEIHSHSFPIERESIPRTPPTHGPSASGLSHDPSAQNISLPSCLNDSNNNRTCFAFSSFRSVLRWDFSCCGVGEEGRVQDTARKSY